MKVTRKTPLSKTTNPTKKPKNCKKPRDSITSQRLISQDAYKFYSKLQPSEAYLEDLAIALFEYASTEPEAYSITKFLRRHKIPPGTFYDWIKKSPYLKAVHKSALEYIGDIREIAALKGAVKGQFVYKKQAYYDPEYRKETERIAELRKIENSSKQSSTIEVVIPQFRDCPEIPKRVIKSED